MTASEDRVHPLVVELRRIDDSCVDGAPAPLTGADFAAVGSAIADVAEALSFVVPPAVTSDGYQKLSEARVDMLEAIELWPEAKQAFAARRAAESPEFSERDVEEALDLCRAALHSFVLRHSNFGFAVANVPGDDAGVTSSVIDNARRVKASMRHVKLISASAAL